jgi:hypothetical protein
MTESTQKQVILTYAEVLFSCMFIVAMLILPNHVFGGGTHVDTKISNCLLCKRRVSHYAKPTSVIRSYLASTYGVTPSCNCRNGCNDT